MEVISGSYLDQQVPENFSYELHPRKRAYNYSLEGSGGILGFAKSMHMDPFLEKFNRILEHAREKGVIRGIVEKYTN